MCIYLCRSTWLSCCAGEFQIMKYIINRDISSLEKQVSCFADNLYVVENLDVPKT